MDEEKIREAIDGIGRSVCQYIEIINMFSRVNVATNVDFQTKFNGFYRIRQRSRDWYLNYYSFMESKKNNIISFSDILFYMRENTNRYEPSFSSKFLATHNQNMPIWDKQVLKSLNMRAPNYYSANRYNEAVCLYNELCGWYENNINASFCRFIIEKFNEKYSDYALLSDVKKIDFVLWRLGT